MILSNLTKAIINLLSIIIFLLISSSSLNAKCNLRSSEVNAFLDSAIAYLEWDAFWFENYLNEAECFKKLTGSMVNANIYSVSTKKNDATHYKLLFDDTYYIFSLKQLNGKVIAPIETGMAGACSDEKIKSNAVHLVKDMTEKCDKCTTIKVRFPFIKPAKLPTEKFNSKNSQIIDTIKRTIEKKFPERINEKILIGRFTDRDPFLLVYFAKDDLLYLYEFPDTTILNNKDICLNEYGTAYKLSYPTEKAEKEYFDKLRQKILRYSIPIKWK